MEKPSLLLGFSVDNSPSPRYDNLLYHLANLCGIDRREEFTRRFIAADREVRR